MVMNVLRIITSDDPFGFRCVAVGPRTLFGSLTQLSRRHCHRQQGHCFREKA